MKKPSISFFQKLLISFILLGTIPLILMGGAVYGFSSQLLQQTIYKQTKNELIKINEDLSILFDDYKRIINVIADDEQIKEVLSGNFLVEDCYDDIYQKIYLLLAGKTNKPPIYILNKKGEMVFSTSILPKIYKIQFNNNWGIFREISKTKKEIVIYPQKNTNSTQNYSVFSMAKKIFDVNGNNIGYIIVDIKRDVIMNIMQRIRSSLLMDIVLVDKYFYTIINMKNIKSEGKFFEPTYKEKIINNKEGKLFKKNNSIMVVFYSHPRTKFTAIAQVPLDIVKKNNQFIKTMIGYFSMGIFLLASFISFLLAKNMVRPIRELVASMKKVEKGDLSTRVQLIRKDEIGLLANSFNHMVHRLKILLDSVVEKQQRLRTAEIKVLQSQINPHFLYNTLDAIKWIAKLNHVEDICVIATHLGKLLRNNINQKNEFVTVEESLDVVKSYLNIQKIRYNGQFEMFIDVDECILKYKIPKLILQPIVENAVIHGLENKGDNGKLIVRGYRLNNDLFFDIIDDGIGMTYEQIKKIREHTDDGHVGIYNVHKRLNLYYGNLYGVKIESSPNEGTKVTIKVPTSTFENSITKESYLELDVER